jgi:1-acyl-sn-glycerol-3-phosphate acyltransferase
MRPLSWYLFLPLNALQAIATIAWGSFWITVALLARLLTGGRTASLWLARRVWAPGQIAIGAARWRVLHRDRVVPNRAYLLVANHQSWIDIPALFVAVPGPLHFLAKRELARVPFLGSYIEAMGMVFVDRGDRRSAVESVDRSRELLSTGAVLASFPEGTRSDPGSIGPFRSGGFGAAIDAGVEVLPVALRGTGRILPRDGFAVRPGTIEIEFGEPIPTAGLAHGDRAELARRAEAAVAAMLGVEKPFLARRAPAVRSSRRRGDAA